MFLIKRVKKKYSIRNVNNYELQLFRMPESLFVECRRCKRDKISRLVAIINRNGKLKLYNACYGTILSISPNQAVKELKGIAAEKEKNLKRVEVEQLLSKVESRLIILTEKVDGIKDFLNTMYLEIEDGSTSIQRTNIMNQILFTLLQSKQEIKKYIDRIIKSDWENDKKNEWSKIVIELLEITKVFSPSLSQKITKAIYEVIGKIIGDSTTQLISTGINNLFNTSKNILNK